MADTVYSRVQLDQSGTLMDVVVGDGLVKAIAPSGTLSAPPAAMVTDGHGALLLPAFVNAHAHLDKALLLETATADRVYIDGYYQGSNLLERKAAFTIADVTARATTLLEWSMQCGVTAIRSHVDVDPYARLVGVEALLALRERYQGIVDIQVCAFPQDGLLRENVTADLMREACRMGVDIVGGKPSADSDRHRHLDIVCDLAAEFDRDLDIHIDTWVGRNYDYNGRTVEVAGRQVPELMETVYLAKRTTAMGWQGRVTASHLCALSTLRPPLAEALIDILLEAGIHVVTCPVSNLSSSARTDTHDVRRGMAPALRLHERGVLTALATDNVGDAWNLFGGPDPMVQVLVAAPTLHCSVVDELWTLLTMATTSPSRMLKLRDRAVKPGNEANFMIVDAPSLWEAVVRVAPRLKVVRGTREIASTVVRRDVVDPARPRAAAR